MGRETKPAQIPLDEAEAKLEAALAEVRRRRKALGQWGG
jgi:hypothetical protein